MFGVVAGDKHIRVRSDGNVQVGKVTHLAAMLDVGQARLFVNGVRKGGSVMMGPGVGRSVLPIHIEGLSQARYERA